MATRSTVSAAKSRTSGLLSRPLVKWIVIGLVIYFTFLIINLPASILFSQFSKRGVQAGTITGTLWHGRAGNVQAGVLRFGNAEWQLRFLPLLSGKLAVDLKITPVKGFAQGRVSISLTGAVAFNDLSASLPLESIVGAGGLPGGWVGTAQVKLSELELKDNWPVAAKGTIDVIDLTGPTREPNNIGAYRLTFGDGASGKKDELVGSLQDLPGAAISVAGKLKLGAGHSYELDTMVGSRPNTPRSIADGMQILGAQDAQGRRPFSVSGTM